MKRFILHPLVFTLLLGVPTILVFIDVAVNNIPAPSRPAQPAVIVEVLDPSLQPYADKWQKEIGRRFDNAVGLLFHGGDFVRGQWIGGTTPGIHHVEPIQDVVKRFQKLYPGRTIVLLACNTGHLDLGIPGVYYAKSSVWCVPDRQVQQGDPESRATLDEDGPSEDQETTPIQAPPRSEIDPDVVGNIFEFVTD